MPAFFKHDNSFNSTVTNTRVLTRYPRSWSIFRIFFFSWWSAFESMVHSQAFLAKVCFIYLHAYDIALSRKTYLGIFWWVFCFYLSKAWASKSLKIYYLRPIFARLKIWLQKSSGIKWIILHGNWFDFQIWAFLKIVIIKMKSNLRKHWMIWISIKRMISGMFLLCNWHY